MVFSYVESISRDTFPPDTITGRYDVIVLGEVLVEFDAGTPLGRAKPVTLSFSGDALNAAAAAAAAGARTALLTAVGDDELGEALLADAVKLGVDISLVRRVTRPNGAYLLASDVHGHREFIYWRTGSAASTLSPEDVEAARDVLSAAACLVTSGITSALSASSREAVRSAVRLVRASGGAVIYDPNFRRGSPPPRTRARSSRTSPRWPRCSHRRVPETPRRCSAPKTRALPPGCASHSEPAGSPSRPDPDPWWSGAASASGA